MDLKIRCDIIILNLLLIRKRVRHFYTETLIDFKKKIRYNYTEPIWDLKKWFDIIIQNLFWI